jgi:hypothetical protein
MRTEDKFWTVAIIAGIIILVLLLFGCSDEDSGPPPKAPLVPGGKALILKDAKGRAYTITQCVVVRNYCGYKASCGYKNLCTVNDEEPS